MSLLGPAEIRTLAEQLDLRPTKRHGQNFVIDPNTVRKIVRVAELEPGIRVLEVGPGLGSLTLGLLEAGHPVTAIEIDPLLAKQLPLTIQDRQPEGPELTVIEADALRVTEIDGPLPEAIVANLPYNVAVPVLLTLLANFTSLRSGLVMVQAEVADRLAAAPGSRVYGVPSVKLQWFGTAVKAGSVGPKVFWPQPNVDSGLVRFTRAPAPDCQASREEVFSAIDAAFSQRRKTLRSALATWAGNTATAGRIVESAGIDPTQRGEMLSINHYCAIADAKFRTAPN